MNNFTVINENYEFKDGETLLVFKLGDVEKEYVLSSLYNNDNNSCNLVISYVDKDPEGYDVLKDITDVEERKHVIETIKEILKGENKDERF